jgi:hypothetical protein
MESGDNVVALPVKVVELANLKMQDGSPVRVRCEAVDELVMAELLGLPGAKPVSSEGSALSKEDEVRALVAMAAPLVHSSTVLLLGDREVRPAFYCDDEHRVDGAIPWRMVRVQDKVNVVVTILGNSGADGAAEASFHGDDREGGGDSVGTLEAGEGVGANTVGISA